MNKLIVNLAKLAVASTGPASVIYSTVLYDQYFDAGMEVSDGVHTVEINNHGNYKYITESQDREISIYLGVGGTPNCVVCDDLLGNSEKIPW